MSLGRHSWIRQRRNVGGITAGDSLVTVQLGTDLLCGWLLFFCFASIKPVSHGKKRGDTLASFPDGSFLCLEGSGSRTVAFLRPNYMPLLSSRATGQNRRATMRLQLQRT